MMILITGAAGKTGNAVLRALTGRGEAVRAWVHGTEQVREVERLGAQEVVAGDLRDAAVREQALRGVSAVYHIPPNVHPAEVEIGREIIAAAEAAGVGHFVYHSVLHPQIEAMPHHWNKMRVEEQLFASGLTWSILQPAVYMQNILANWAAILETGTYPVPYAVATRLSMVDLEDVALAAGRLLTDLDDQDRPMHQGATYELVGTPAMSQEQVAEVLSQQLGRPVRAEAIPLEVWERKARASGLGDDQVDTLVKMFRYYEEFGFSGNPQALSWLLDRPATSFEAFVRRMSEERVRLAR